MRIITAALACLLTSLAGLQAQILFNNFSAKTESFDSFAGTALSVPANWTWSDSDYTPGGYYSRNATYSALNSTYALVNDLTSTEAAFGAKIPTSGTFTLTASTQNTTGTTLTGFTVLWDVEQYSAGFRATNINFSYRIGAGSFGTVGVTGTTLTSASLGASDGVNLASITTTSRSISISGLSVANLATLDFRWSWTNGTGSGSNAHIGIDNVSLTAIPEPSTWILFGIGGLFMVWNLRRKRTPQSLAARERVRD